jgi:hypothetical protein
MSAAIELTGTELRTLVKVAAVAFVATMLLLRKYRRDVADWNATHPHRSFGGVR